MFVFEVYETGIFYSSLHQIPLAEGLLVKVYPVVSYDLKLPTYKWGFIEYRCGNWENLSTYFDYQDGYIENGYIELKQILIYRNYVFQNMEVLKLYLINKGKIRSLNRGQRYPVPPSVHSSLFLEEKAKLDRELEEYHREHNCKYHKLNNEN